MPARLFGLLLLILTIPVAVRADAARLKRSALLPTTAPLKR